MSEAEMLFQILKSFDSFIALGIAVWIIQIGIKRMDKLQETHNAAMKDVMEQQQNANASQQKLIETLCVQSIQNSPKAVKPRMESA